MEALIETVGRALTVCSLYRELISWRDLCALFKVCRVSEGATHHSAQSRLQHIWSGSFRVTCTHTQTHACKCWHRSKRKHAPVHKEYPTKCIISWLIMCALCSSEDEHAHTLPHKRCPVSHWIYWPFYSQLRWPPPPPALHLRDAGTAIGSTSRRIPKHRRKLCCQSPFMKVLL